MTNFLWAMPEGVDDLDLEGGLWEIWDATNDEIDKMGLSKHRFLAFRDVVKKECLAGSSFGKYMKP